VTGVQTCALPISPTRSSRAREASVGISFPSPVAGHQKVKVDPDAARGMTMPRPPHPSLHPRPSVERRPPTKQTPRPLHDQIQQPPLHENHLARLPTQEPGHALLSECC